MLQGRSCGVRTSEVRFLRCSDTTKTAPVSEHHNEASCGFKNKNRSSPCDLHPPRKRLNVHVQSTIICTDLHWHSRAVVFDVAPIPFDFLTLSQPECGAIRFDRRSQTSTPPIQRRVLRTCRYKRRLVDEVRDDIRSCQLFGQQLKVIEEQHAQDLTRIE